MDQVGNAALEVESKTENLSKVREFMSDQVSQSGLQPADRNKVVLAVDEAVSNIIKHAYQEKIEGEIKLEVEFDDEKFRVTILDRGLEFDPGAVTDVDIMEHVKQGRKTGLGIFLMRQIMDEVKYTFREGSDNELFMVKYISPPPEGESRPSA
jgi:serine/threonine-protein kinase RsbW